MMSLEHLVVPESKEVLNKQKHTKNKTKQTKVQWWGMLKPTERAPFAQSWNNLSNKINSIEFDNNSSVK